VVDGKKYRSNRYDFMTGSSSGYQGKKELVDKYLKLKHTVCYVNPESPGDAVLNRDLTWRYGIGLFALIFVAVGLAVMIDAVFGMKRRAAKESIGGWKPQTAFTSSHQSGSMGQEKTKSPSSRKNIQSQCWYFHCYSADSGTACFHFLCMRCSLDLRRVVRIGV
jgi:hypothetical protein